MPDNMDDAVLLGSIAMVFVEGNQKRKEAFMDLMRGVVGDVIEEKTGHRPTWPDGAQPAPEAERSGHG